MSQRSQTSPHMVLPSELFAAVVNGPRINSRHQGGGDRYSYHIWGGRKQTACMYVEILVTVLTPWDALKLFPKI